MKNLLIKEIRLAASPLSWIFIAFAVMALIPNYPIMICGFFVCFGIFHTFQNSRENNDLLYTVLLPVRKSDAVRVKYAFTVLIQSIALVLTIVLTLVRMIFLTGMPYAESALVVANQYFLAGVLVIYLLFNTLFLAYFFRTGWKLGKGFVFFAVAAFLFVCIAEVLHHIPGLTFLNAVDSLNDLPMWGLTAAALVLWLTGTKLSMNYSIKCFENLDL